MKLIVLDRDGVINQDSDAFIKSPEEFIPIEGSLEAIAKLNQNGYEVVIASNQSGIARNYFSLEVLAEIHEKLRDLLAQQGGAIAGIFFCPHGPDDHCDCRKPKPGLLQQIEKEFGVSLKNVPAVGDSLRDIQAAQAMGACPVLVRTGKGESTFIKGEGLTGVPVFADLSDYVTNLLVAET